MGNTAVGAVAGAAPLRGAANIAPEPVDENGDLAGAATGTRMAPAPFTSVIKGGFTVVHAGITKSPTQTGQVTGRG